VKQVAASRGRDPEAVTGAMYLTVSSDDNEAAADQRLNQFLERYYEQPAEKTRQRQACYAGPPGKVVEWLDSYAQAGASHLVLRFAGDHTRHLDTFAKLRPRELLVAP
jgi:alkanesulfonate monooxygenase SsuD/methylene tetrahydromethanopterin reductase-like flavin-dependent oxidoreductase (luciferase family)